MDLIDRDMAHEIRASLAGAFRQVVAWLLDWPSQRPVATLIAAGVVTIVAGWQAAKLEPNATMQSMVDGRSRAGGAMVQVATHFDALNDLLLFVTPPGSAPGTPGTPGPGDTPENPRSSEGGDRGFGPGRLGGFSRNGEGVRSPVTERLVSFAQRLEAAIRDDPEAAGLCRRVVYQAGPEQDRFLREVVEPAFLYYLDEDLFSELMDRLRPERIRQLVGMSRAMMAAPVASPGGGMAGMQGRDPLRLYELALATVRRLTGSSQAEAMGDRFVSPDGRALLIRIVGERPSSDLEFAGQITEAVERVVEQVKQEGLEVRLAGGYAIAATNHRAIRGDMIRSVVGSVAALQAVFLILYRRLTAFLVAFVPVAMGIVWGFGGFAAVWASVSPLGAVSGAVLAGLGVDYSIHFLSHYGARRHARQNPFEAVRGTVVQIGPAMATACATSVVGFGVVLWKDIAVLRDFAVIGILGLIGVFLASLTVLPAILCLTDSSGGQADRGLHQRGHKRWVESAVRGMGRAGWWGPAVCVGGLLVVWALGGMARGLGEKGHDSEGGDLAAFHAKPNPALETQGMIAAAFGQVHSSVFVHLQADSDDRLLRLAHEAHRRVMGEKDRVGIDRVFGLATLFPDPAGRAERERAIAQIDTPRVLGDLETALLKSVLNERSQREYVRFVGGVLNSHEPPTVEDLRRYPTLATMVLSGREAEGSEPGDGGAREAMMWLFFREPMLRRANRDSAIQALQSALEGIGGATLTGPTVLAYETEREIFSDSVEFGLAVGLAVLGWLLMHFRRAGGWGMWVDAGLCLVPVAYGLVALAAYLHLAGETVNMVNLLVFPVMIGIGVDYGVFLVDAVEKNRTSGCGSGEEQVQTLTACYHAVGAACATTVLSFGSLVSTSVPAIQSLGRVMTVGVTACFVGAVCVLGPVLLIRGRSGGRGRLLEAS